MSIWTVYPFVEVVFEGKTVHAWIDEAITNADSEEIQLLEEIAVLRQELEQQPASGAVSTQIDLKQGRLALCRRSGDFFRRVQPFAQQWAPATAFGTLLLVVALLVLASTMKGLCLVLNAYLVARVANGTTRDLRRLFFRRALEMRQRQLDTTGVSQLMTMLSHQVQLIQAGLAGFYGKSIREPLKILVCLTIACFISWKLLLVSLLVAPLGALAVHYISTRMKKAARRELRGYSAVFQTLMEMIGGMTVVRIFTLQRTARQRFKRDVQSLYRMSMSIALYDSMIRPATELIGVLTLAVAIICGAYIVLNQQTHLFGLQISASPLAASQMFTFFAMLAGIADPARKISDIYNVLVRACMASEGLFTTFEEHAVAPAAKTRRATPIHSKSIRFQDVTFGYDPQVPVLHDFNLEIPFGQTVALVGSNGSGKSTIVKLLAKFYDPQRGQILVDDVDIKDMRPRQLHKQIGLLSQDCFLFRGSIRDNVQYGNLTADEDDFHQAAGLSGVSDFVNKLPAQFRTGVGDRGSLLSGGQRQRVALARALLADPRILILDEPTSQMDAESAAILHKSLREFLSGRTVILITHSLSTLAMADRVIVMEAGRIMGDFLAAEAEDGLKRLSPQLMKVA
jgi:ATP-binding cassette subfamily B protein/subfamily B ATP-binding cassette protein MsbA